MFALLETVFHVADIFSDFGYSIYSIYFLLFFPSIIIFFFVFCLLWLTSYYVVGIHAYCVVRTINWVGGVDVCNVGSPLFVCACFVGTPVCVLHAGCLNDNWSLGGYEFGLEIESVLGKFEKTIYNDI